MNKYVEGRDYMEMPGGGRLGGTVDHMALIAELQAEKAGLERIIMAQEVALTELREGMDAVGAGGVSLMGSAALQSQDAERMSFIEANPGWLRISRLGHRTKQMWACASPFTNYEYDLFKTAREAIDQARADTAETQSSERRS